jgi:hypothetical protein
MHAATYGHEPPLGDENTQSARLYGEGAKAKRTYALLHTHSLL